MNPSLRFAPLVRICNHKCSKHECRLAWLTLQFHVLDLENISGSKALTLLQQFFLLSGLTSETQSNDDSRCLPIYFNNQIVHN